VNDGHVRGDQHRRATLEHAVVLSVLGRPSLHLLVQFAAERLREVAPDEMRLGSIDAKSFEVPIAVFEIPSSSICNGTQLHIQERSSSLL
jgi:hypothetical protein